MIDFSKIDKVIHERGRLSIMTLLAARNQWTFQDLKNELHLSDGNLITHLRTLYDHGYISISKLPSTPRPQTTYALTPAGKKAFAHYLDVLEQIVKQTRR
jgi:DNA-binding HxlR family transcriptional regulator